MTDTEIEHLLQLTQERDELKSIILELKKALDNRESNIVDLNEQLSELENPCSACEDVRAALDCMAQPSLEFQKPDYIIQKVIDCLARVGDVTNSDCTDNLVRALDSLLVPGSMRVGA